MISLIYVYDVQNYSNSKSDQKKDRFVTYASSQDHKEWSFSDFLFKGNYLHDWKQLCGDNRIYFDYQKYRIFSLSDKKAFPDIKIVLKLR